MGSGNVIVLNRGLYDRHSVEESLRDFGAVFSGNVREDGKSLVVSMRKVRGDSDMVKREFCNYVLATMKNRGVV